MGNTESEHTLFNQESTMLKAIVIEPKEQADACVIWLHGLGADGHDFADVVPSLNLAPNHRMRFIFPHAPHQPVTLNGGMVMPAWYDISAIDLDMWQDDKGIRTAEQNLKALIESVIQSGIPAKRIILIGFSQGGALALHTAVRFEQSLGGVAGLSTYLPLHASLGEERHANNHQIPLFLGHGLMDPIVSYWIGQKSMGYLQAVGFQPEWHVYPMVHTVSLPELNDLGQWMQRILA